MSEDKGGPASADGTYGQGEGNWRTRSSSSGTAERWPDLGFQKQRGSDAQRQSGHGVVSGREEANGEITMFDVFFRRFKKDFNLKIIADAVKEGVRDVVNAGSNAMVAATGMSSTTGRSSLHSTTSRASATSATNLSEAESRRITEDIGAPYSGDDSEGGEANEVEYVTVQLKNASQNFEGSSDGPSIFVKSTRLSQTLAHHVGGIYAMEFSPDGKFLATAGEDTSLVIWAVGQKQYQPEEDYDHAGSRPVSGNYSESDYKSRPESGAYTASSLGYGYGNTSDSSRPNSGNYSDFRDGASSDGVRSTSNSGSPHTVGDGDGTITPKSQGGSSVSGDSDAGDDDIDGDDGRASDFNQGSIGSDLSGDVSGKYSANMRGRTDSGFSKDYVWPSVPRGTRRDKVVDRDVIIYPYPARVYSKGHNEPIVDICWSKSNFLLTGSVDKSVCLWHVSQNEFLQRFEHGGIVTSVDFHPVHDRYFISGCFDGKIRFWDVISNTTLDFILTRSGGEEDAGKITCVKFSPDGGKIVAGFFGGKVVVYYCLARGDMKYELKYQTEFFCKDRAGAYMAGRKITGLNFVEGTKASLESGVPLAPSRSDLATGSIIENYLLLVTTNDSNVRLVDWAEKSTFIKYKGGLNETLQTQATTSDCNRFIITGTDDGNVILWEMQHFDNPMCLPLFEPPRPHKRNAMHAKFNSAPKDKKTGQAPAVTAARFAPISAVHNLLESAEDLYCLAVGGRESTRSRFNSFGSAENDNSLSSYQGESTPSGGSTKQGSSVEDAYKEVPLYRPEDEASFSSLIIATSDLDGNIRIYTREQ